MARQPPGGHSQLQLGDGDSQLALAAAAQPPGGRLQLQLGGGDSQLALASTEPFHAWKHRRHFASFCQRHPLRLVEQTRQGSLAWELAMLVSLGPTS
mmetsp:Transcript_52849/g.123016  ORF Transcript_52849/g.123016 Transcript_52849/m.123016 type:complete len:97 (+) Transcript_52849:118-408(+)